MVGWRGERGGGVAIHYTYTLAVGATRLNTRKRGGDRNFTQYTDTVDIDSRQRLVLKDSPYSHTNNPQLRSTRWRLADRRYKQMSPPPTEVSATQSVAFRNRHK